jgi:hypothetical protein
MQSLAVALLQLPQNMFHKLQVRVGNTNDDEEDYSIPVWAGVVPLKVTPGVPIQDPRLDSGLENSIPDYILPYQRPTEMAP